MYLLSDFFSVGMGTFVGVGPWLVPMVVAPYPGGNGTGGKSGSGDRENPAKAPVRSGPEGLRACVLEILTNPASRTSLKEAVISGPQVVMYLLRH